MIKHLQKQKCAGKGTVSFSSGQFIRPCCDTSPWEKLQLQVVLNKGLMPPLTWGKPSFSLKNRGKTDNSKEPVLISDKNNWLIKIFFLRIEGNILASCVTSISQDCPLTLFSQNPLPPRQCTKTMASCIDGFSLIISLYFFVSLAPSVVSCLRVEFPALGCGHWGCSQQELQALERYE